jgi:hypothetical protein
LKTGKYPRVILDVKFWILNSGEQVIENLTSIISIAIILDGGF